LNSVYSFKLAEELAREQRPLDEVLAWNEADEDKA
jgi:hypothetical protein